jgi:hypothetical protein
MNLSQAIAITAHGKDTPSANKKMTVSGLPVTIEVPRGKDRVLHDDDGKQVYRRRMFHHYGFLNGTKGRDGDEVDVFVGPISDAKEAYIIHMRDMGPVPEEREDEDKVFLGFSSADAAKAAFLLHYPPTFYDGMTALPIEQFKKKLATASLPYRKKKITAAATNCPQCKRHLDVKDRRAGACQFCGRKIVRGDKNDVTAAEQKCPKCASKKIVLMPTDYETAKCSGCGHTFKAKNPPMPGKKKKLKGDSLSTTPPPFMPVG